MMYTFGDVRVPLPSTAQLVERIVHKQLVDIVRPRGAGWTWQIVQAARVALEVRAARSLAAEDVIFVVRRDAVKVDRLKEFLTWKDLRKNAKPGDDSTLAVGEGVEVPEEELLGLSQIETLSASVAGGAAASALRPRAARRRHAKLPWDLIAGLVVEGSGGTVDLLDDEPVDPDAQVDIARRLHEADVLTRDMTREEYMEYAECRQASFTYKKAKKFRDWMNPVQYIDYRLNDDVVEILGFLAWDMVRRITERALSLKRRDHSRAAERSSECAGAGAGAGGCVSGCVSVSVSLSARNESDLFKSPSQRTAILPRHVHAAVVQVDGENVRQRGLCRMLPVPSLRRRVRLY